MYVLARPSPTCGEQTLDQMQGAAAARQFPLLRPKALLLPHATATSPGVSWMAPGAPPRVVLGHLLLATLSAPLLAMVRPLQLVPPRRWATPIHHCLRPFMQRMRKSHELMTSGSGRRCLLSGVGGAPESTTRESQRRPVGALSAVSTLACELICVPCLLLWAVGESTRWGCCRWELTLSVCRTPAALLGLWLARRVAAWLSFWRVRGSLCSARHRWSSRCRTLAWKLSGVLRRRRGVAPAGWTRTAGGRQRRRSAPLPRIALFAALAPPVNRARPTARTTPARRTRCTSLRPAFTAGSVQRSGVGARAPGWRARRRVGALSIAGRRARRLRQAWALHTQSARVS